VIRLLVSNYFDIVRNNLADLVPKALMRFLVHHSQRGLQQHLIATLYRCVCVEGGVLGVCVWGGG
jgi:dynamin 1-like protein